MCLHTCIISNGRSSRSPLCGDKLILSISNTVTHITSIHFNRLFIPLLYLLIIFLFVCFFYTPPPPQPQRSSITGGPFLSMQGELAFNPEADPLQNEALVQMWMEVRINPLLKSVTKHFLTCLSTKTFSCRTYQTMYVWISVYTFLLPLSQNPISPSYLFLQGEGAQQPLFWDGSRQTKVDLHILHVPLSVRRQSSW